MRDRLTDLELLLLPLLLALLLASGCGGGGEGNSTSNDGTPVGPAGPTTAPAQHPVNPAAKQVTSGQAGPPASAFHPKPHHDSGGGSQQFIVKGGDNSVQEYGAEAPESELDQAAAALHGFLDARAERNWAAACTYLSQQTRQGFAQLPGAEQRGCLGSLAALSGKVPTATLREAAIADVGALRAQGVRAFLIYRGAPKGTIYAVPMTRQGGGWKVASLAGTPLD